MMIVPPQQWFRRSLVSSLVLMGSVGMLGQAWSASLVWPVQMPYVGAAKIRAGSRCVRGAQHEGPHPEELQRAEALLPLLEGKQEFWAMGEFVHLGESVLPVVTKALTMPGPRIRYNAIETIWMIKAPAAVPAFWKRRN